MICCDSAGAFAVEAGRPVISLSGSDDGARADRQRFSKMRQALVLRPAKLRTSGGV